MFINLRQYCIDNKIKKKNELRNQDLELWEQLDDTDIVDLAFSKAQKLEILCICLLCISGFLLMFGFLTYFHIINIEDLVKALRQCALM